MLFSPDPLGERLTLLWHNLEDGDLKMAVDFRRVYASVLKGWLGLSSHTALGGEFDCLPVVRHVESCTRSSFTISPSTAVG
jgi:hypothetical protein